MGERPVGPGRAGRPDRENKGRGGKAGGPANIYKFTEIRPFFWLAV